MHPRFGAALAALVLAFAPASPAIETTSARALSGDAAGSIRLAADDCTSNPCYTVAIAATGGGSGRVQSTNAQFVPDGVIDCPMVRGIIDTTLCSHKYADTTDTGVVVYIKATPAPGSEVCDENGCTTEPRLRSRLFTNSGTFAETFNLLVFDVHLAKAGSGSGRITSAPPYLDCGTECETSLEAGEVLVFTARPSPGSKFSKWTGGCAGQNATCEITLMADLTTTAVFTALATPEPTVEATDPAQPSATTAAESVAPTVDATAVPTLVPPTPEPTPAPGPSDAGAGSAPIVILLAILLVGLLGGLGVVLVRGRRAPVR